MNAQLLSHSRIARRHDPETSHLAAAEITQSGKRATQQEIVRNIVRAAPGSPPLRCPDTRGILVR